jgi:anaerobic selenocysteine-containing dehydrogenase
MWRNWASRSALRAPIWRASFIPATSFLWACNTIGTNLHHWPFIAEAQKRGAEIVVVDPVKTRTARQADWHIPIKPGTDGALAMAMINVITGRRRFAV